MYLMAGAIACVLALFFFAGSDDKKKQDKEGGESAAASGRASPTSSPASAPVNFPALHFASSGRLPTSLHRFRLGMTLAQAIADDPSLKDRRTQNDPGSPSPLLDPDAVLSTEGFSAGFYDEAGFSHGALIDISSDVYGIRPDDASQFDQDMLNQLGKPDAKVYAGPSEEVWVWIDGDVRIRYENRLGGTGESAIAGARTLTLAMAIYPAVIKETQNSVADSAADRDSNLEMEKNFWGEDAGREILKHLPAGLSDVRLRMTPLELRSSFPGIEFTRPYSSPEHREEVRELKSANVVTDMNLWDGLVCTIYRRWDHLSANQISDWRRRLTEDLGTPSLRSETPSKELWSYTWEDGTTKIDYTFLKDQVNAWYRDKNPDGLYWGAERANAPPSQPKPAPEVHSFF